MRVKRASVRYQTDFATHSAIGTIHAIGTYVPVSVGFARAHLDTWEQVMNNIIWLVGAIVIVLAILGFLGLR